MTRHSRRALWALATAVLVGCSGENPESLIASAKDFLAKNDAKAAIIQVKTALQEQPSNAEARYLLGKALVLSGDAAAASIELRKALDLGHPEEIVAPELADALLTEGKHLTVTELFANSNLSDPLSNARLKSTLARSYAVMGRRDMAQQALQGALKSVPGYGPAEVLGARLQADEGDLDGALATVEALIARSADDYDAWQLKGDLLNYGKRDQDGAMAAYRQAVTLKPNFVPAHSALLSLLLGKQDVAAAREQLDKLRAVLPNHPQTAYFAGNIELLDKNIDKAREIAQALLRVAPDNPRVLQLAGAVEFEKRSYLLAETHLARALQKAPEQETSRRLLALTYLQLSQPAKTLATLQPLLDKPDPGAAVYAMAAQAHLQAGDLDAAQEAFAQAARIDPDDKRTRTALAVSKVLQGNADAGLADLKILAAGDDATTADLPLIGALVRKKDYAGALKAIDALEKKTPDKPIAANLQARVLMQQGKRDQARAAFERALQIQPGFYPATSALAQLALQDGKPEEAQRLLDAALKADPRNMQALLASARLKASNGAPREEIVAVFTAAIQQSPTDAAPRLALVNYHLANKDFKAARDIAQAAATALPDSVDILESLGRAQAATGDTNQALASFNQLTQLLPQSPVPHLRLADVQWKEGNREAAMQSLRRALGIAPDNLPAQRALIDAYLTDKDAAQAIGVARQIQQQRPTQDVGFLLEGGIEASRKQWDEALAAYRKGLKAAPDSSELASRVHVALMSTNQQAAADKHVADWLKAHPKDAAFQFYLGDYALASRQLPQAELRYREVLKLQPDNALALNNVAWLMATAKKPGSVELARKAVALLPDRPVIMDTLALALASEGQMPEAVTVMKKALALQDNNPQLRLNLAKLLVQAGDKPGAKTELEALAALGDKFPRQGEVAELLKTL